MYISESSSEMHEQKYFHDNLKKFLFIQVRNISHMQGMQMEAKINVNDILSFRGDNRKVCLDSTKVICTSIYLCCSDIAIGYYIVTFIDYPRS